MNKEQKAFHKSRRDQFAKIIGKDSVAIIFGNTHRNKSYDGDYKFKQYKNFYYLTGFEEPNSALMIVPGGVKVIENKKENTVKEILFVQEKDPLMETWNGRRLGFENVKTELGIESAKVNKELGKFLNGKGLQRFSKLYINFGEVLKLTDEMKTIVTPFLNSLNVIAPHMELIDISYELGKMRLIKTEFEIRKIQEAADISVDAYYDAMKAIRPDFNEFNIQSILEFYYRFHGGDDIAYHPIVAAGENACIMHYDKNDQHMNKNELLLIDSASEYNYYCSDITRTFPISGKFTKEQRIIYDIVLKANKECIKKIKPGVKFTAIRDLSERVLADGLFKAGLLKNKKDIKKYSLHGVGHHIGLDTHDAVPYSKTLDTDFDTLKAGNVLTIEPGLYFTQDMKEIPQKFRGIGVRIEDDILVTKNGCVNMTGDLIKEAFEIEEEMLFNREVD
ncbi:MAG TPA: aminopeptidase P family protein [Ignavibacteria bacterium]|nr:aminopeptidase P family protein [Ignavibacteria bacterium]